jgi:hypothetical protein
MTRCIHLEQTIAMNIQLVESIKQLILALPSEEQGWSKAQLIQASNSIPSQAVDLNSFSGTIQLKQDPLEFQHQMRGEWA